LAQATLTLPYLLKLASRGAADRALLRGFTGYSIATDRADKVRLILQPLTGIKGFKRLLKEFMMYLLYLVSISKASLGSLVALRFSLLNKRGVHPGKLIVLPHGTSYQIIPG